MSTPDILNATFEFIGGIMIMLSVYRAWKTRLVVGVHWATPTFFWSWGAWNIFYYPHLGQWVSFAAGLFIVLANTLWTASVFTLKPKTGEQVGVVKGLEGE